MRLVTSTQGETEDSADCNAFLKGKELQDEENEYLDYIMPTLYKIVTRLQEYVANSTNKFEKIYS